MVHFLGSTSHETVSMTSFTIHFVSACLSLNEQYLHLYLKGAASTATPPGRWGTSSTGATPRASAPATAASSAGPAAPSPSTARGRGATTPSASSRLGRGKEQNIQLIFFAYSPGTRRRASLISTGSTQDSSAGGYTPPLQVIMNLNYLF